MTESSFETTPIWLIFFLTMLAILVASELGHRFGMWRLSKGHEPKEQAPGLATGAMLGLVSFLLAFTFGVAATNFADRRVTVMKEANAIGTAYLRTEVLPQAEAEKMRALMFEYVTLRVDVPKKAHDAKALIDLIKHSEALQKEMWAIALDAAKESPTPVNALLLAALNEMFDLHSERISVGIYRMIPSAVWTVLLLVSIIGLASASYRMTTVYKERSDLLPALVVSFAAVISLIADLDNPRKGVLRSDQSPMEYFLETILPDHQK